MVALGMRENGLGFVIDAVPSLHAGAQLLRVTAVGAELLFEVLSQRYERGSTLMPNVIPLRTPQPRTPLDQ